MIEIKPQTYNEVVRLARCLEAQKKLPGITDEQVCRMYYHLTLDKANRLEVTPKNIDFYDSEGNCIRSEECENYNYSLNINSIEISASKFSVHLIQTGSHSSTWRYSSYGSSGNNNNNNNNNNNG